MTDHITKFARQVAPLYVYHNWLGLGERRTAEDLSYADVVNRLDRIARGLYNKAVRQAEERPDQRYFVSTARMIATYEPWEDGPEIRLGLDLDVYILHEGEFVNLFDDRFKEE
ncbi:MAG: hypothetical protein LC650_00310 [Actinobacteria bacterium]|nr:hypothetical protein [Actinomycetota bacterium]